MPETYITKQFQTVDLVCADHYGRTADVTEAVLSTNQGLAALGPILPMGTKIVLPDAPARKSSATLVKLWD